jgi:hypothetical protein
MLQGVLAVVTEGPNYFLEVGLTTGTKPDESSRSDEMERDDFLRRT